MAKLHFFLCMPLLVSSTLLGNEMTGKPDKPIPAKIDYARDVRPILSSICLNCHGADKESRKAGLRLDTKEGATEDLNGSRAIVPGNLKDSALYQRITSKDPEEVMPPPSANHKLSLYEIAVLKKWIEQGAVYSDHWAWAKPVKAPTPPLKNAAWAKNAIDQFVLARLEQEGLQPSAPADKPALLRRVSIDLTGLPPTPQETDAFLADTSPNAYEKAIDRLMASPRFGERWARMWLDLSRYADSAGYGSDPLRLNIWPFRDWTIDAFNRNLPYDQFIVEQLAGDLLPNPTNDQLVATAFHRNTMTNTEGGTDDEEFRVAAVKDRIGTTMQVFMGLTMGCAQCHTHKFDPISQKEYYQGYAFFNQTEDTDRGDEFPTMPLPTGEQKAETERLKGEIAKIKTLLESPNPEFDTAQTAWEEHAKKPVEWTVLKPDVALSAGGAKLAIQPDGSVLASGNSPDKDTYTINAKVAGAPITAVRLELLTDDSLPHKGPGRNPGDGSAILSSFSVAPMLADPKPVAARFVRVEIQAKGVMLHLAEVEVFSKGANVALKGKATQSSTDYEGPPNLGNDGNTNGDYAGKSVFHTKQEDNPWWEVDLGATVDADEVVVWNRIDGGTASRLRNWRVVVMDEKRKELFSQKMVDPTEKSMRFNLKNIKPVKLQNATADSGSGDNGIEKAIDGDAGKSGWKAGGKAVRMAQFEIANAKDLEGAKELVLKLEQNGGKDQTLGKFRISVTTAALPQRVLSKELADILALDAAKRADAQKSKLREYFRAWSPIVNKPREEMASLNGKLTNIKPVAVPILRELPKEKFRKTRILDKGNFLVPRDEVSGPAVLAKFHPLPKDAPLNRLGLAQWIIDPQNPLTARVAVNRYWAQLFGTGIVETEEDFGTQGQLPSHPELIDWLAVDFMEKKWDIKALLKFMVTSATYQQSAKVTADRLEKDPRGRLVSRFPRRRLDAEMVRDQALQIAGLLSPKIGGPSVYPPQPDGLWRAAFNGERSYATSKGEDKYRRGMYTIWRRTIPYPSMNTFDAPSRETCTIRRISTNTPLQAFVTMNDPVYVEASQALARRLVKEGGASIEDRVRFGLKLALCRPANDAQVQSLLKLYNEELANYKKDADAAKKMATDPLGPVPEGMDAAELAAWTIVANVLLNLDGILMKG